MLLEFETWDDLGRLSDSYTDMLGHTYDQSLEDIRAYIEKMWAEQHRSPTSMRELEIYLRTIGQID